MKYAGFALFFDNIGKFIERFEGWNRDIFLWFYWLDIKLLFGLSQD